MTTVPIADEDIPDGIKTKPFCVGIHLERCEQMLHHDNHFANHGLEQDAADFLLAEVKKCPIWKPMLLMIYLESLPNNIQKQESLLQAKVANFFEAEAKTTRLRTKRLLRRGTISFSISCIMFFVALVIKALLNRYLADVNGVNIVIQACDIISWVILWPPLNLLVFQWWPVAYRWLLLHRISTRIYIVIKPFDPIMMGGIQDLNRKSKVLTQENAYLLERATGPWIVLRVNSIAQLFNTTNPDPFFAPALDENVAAYLFSELWSQKRGPKGRLNLDLQVQEAPRRNEDPNDLNSLSDYAIEKAIRKYFQRKVEIVNYQIKSEIQYGLCCLAIGVILYLILVTIGEEIAEAQNVPQLLLAFGELIEVGAWVVLWYPVELLWFCWWEPLRDRSRYQRLRTLKVHLRRVAQDESARVFGTLGKHRSMKDLSASLEI